MELDVGRAVVAVGAGEQEGLGDGRGERAATAEQEVEQGRRLLGVGKRGTDRRVPDPDHVGVILEIGADRGQRDPRLDAGRGELVRVADPGQHQELRGADRAGGEDHLVPRPGDGHRGPAAQLHAADPVAADLEAEGGCPGQDGQVRAPRGRPQERIGGAPPAPLLLGHLDGRDAVGRAVVVVAVGVVAEVAGGADHQLGQRARAAQRRDVEQPAVAVRGARSGFVMLGADEVGEDVVPAPALAAGVVAPAVIVGAMPTDVEHRVHRARAAERLAARHVDGASVAAGLRPGRVVPVELRPELLSECGRDLDLRRSVAAAGFDQQDLGAGVAEPVREHAPGRSRTDDHIVEVAHSRSSRFPPAGRS